MTVDKILVAFFSFLGIIFTWWYFLMKKEREVRVEGEVDIMVDGGYQPEKISIPKGKITRINFFRKDPSSCLEEVVMADFKIRKFLPLNKKTTVEIAPPKKGEFSFSCGMGMFHGKVIVK